MKLLVLLLAIFGLSNGLQSDLEYKYEYFGSIANAIPELSSQASGIAIKGDITVQVQKEGVALIQFTNVKTAEFNDKLGCDLRGDIPADFNPIQEDFIKVMVEKPFKANLLKDHEGHEKWALVVDKEEIIWVTNMKKAIVSFAHNQITEGNFIKEHNFFNSETVLHEFDAMEETIHGKCKVDYTIHKIPGYLAAQKEHYFEETIVEDIQSTHDDSKHPSKKGSIKHGKEHQTITEDLWHVTRSVDFDHCEERFGAQKARVGIDEPLGGNQYEWLQGRSSFSEYIVKGSGGAARIERAAVEGATTMAPIGLKSEHVESRTNMTFKLISVHEPEHLLEMPSETKEIKTWMQEVISPAEEPKINAPHTWVRYTGSKMQNKLLEPHGAASFNPNDLKNIKDNILLQVNFVANHLADLDNTYDSPLAHGEYAETLEMASFHSLSLSKEDFLELFSKLQDKKEHRNEIIAWMLMIDVAAASGTTPAIQAILETIKADKIPTPKIISFLATLSSHMRCPSILPELGEYVMSLDLKVNPFLASTAYINFANIVHEMCAEYDYKHVHYMGDMYGDHTCDLNVARDKFAPFLKNIITSEDSSDWEKNIAIQAISELGHPNLIPFLRKIIMGEIKMHHYGRIMAIYTLENEKFHKFKYSHLRDEIISMMNEIYSNIGEDYDVRIAAVTTLITWEPEANFWHRLARSTWREPSRQVAAYVTSLLESVAKSESTDYVHMVQAASHAVKFTKPVAPSCKYSKFSMGTHTNLHNHVSVTHMLDIIRDPDNPYYKDFYFIEMINAGGFDTTFLEMYFDHTHYDAGFTWKETLFRHHEESYSRVFKPSEKAKEYYKMVEDIIKPQFYPRNRKFRSNLFLRIFEQIKLFFTINHETYLKTRFADNDFAKNLMMQLSQGFDLNLVKYFNPTKVNSLHSTDIGLPLFFVYSTPMVISHASHSTLEFGDKQTNFKKWHLNTDFVGTFSSKSSSFLAVLVPWTNSFVKSEVKSTRDLILPLSVSITDEQSQTTDTGKVVETHIDVHPLYYNKFTVFQATSIPFTKFVPIASLPDYGTRKIIVDVPVKEKTFDVPQTYSGLKFDVTWISEKPFPLNMFKLGKLLGKPTPDVPFVMWALGTTSIKPWSIEVKFDYEASETKNISMCLSAAHLGKSLEHHHHHDESEDFSQYDENTFKEFNVNDLSQEIVHPNKIDISDDIKQRSEKLQQNFGGPVHSVGLKFDFKGKKERSYEFLYTWSKTYPVESRKQKKSQLAFFRGPVPGVDDQSLSVCLDVQKSKPKFSPLHTLDSLDSANLDTAFIAEITVGCTGHPVVTVKGSYHLSEKAKQNLVTEIAHSCDYDPYDPLLTLEKHAVYDQIQYSVGWEKVCDMKRLPLLTRFVTFVDDVSGIDFKHVHCDNDHDSNKKFVLNAERCSKTHHWHLKKKRDGHEMTVHVPKKIENYLDEFFAVKRNFNFEHVYPHHFTTIGTESNKCSIGTDSVRTFDGHTYKYPSTSCWSVAAADCAKEKEPTILIRTPEGSNVPELRYIADTQYFVLDIGKDVKLNGKVINIDGHHKTIKDEKTEEPMVTIYKKNNYYMAKFYGFDDEFTVALKERVEIIAEKELHGKTCGLCGNFNGEPKDELIGPKHCYYGCHGKFVSAWTAVSETCDPTGKLVTREKIADYQKTCKTIEESLHKHDDYDHYCTNYGYMLSSTHNLTCLSKHPVPYCSTEKNCHSLHHPVKKVKFSCWPKDVAPDFLKGHKNSDHYPYPIVNTAPITVEGYEIKKEYLHLDTSCRTF